MYDICIFIILLSFSEGKSVTTYQMHTTGCDCISKVGRKGKALPGVHLLDAFGECELNENIIKAAEEYLVSVPKGKKYVI